jgi:gluconokinase
MTTHAPAWDPPLVVLVMGVSATGKTSVGRELAEQLDLAFEEGDQHHPPANIAKMSRGVALTDADRHPWLVTLAGAAGDHVAAGRSVVVTCSALKRSYRDLLRSHLPPGAVVPVHLTGDFEVLHARMSERTSHFMPPDLLRSQFADLEPLGDDEGGVVVDVGRPLVEVVADARRDVLAVVAGRG